jgi:chorismate mutase
MDDALLISKLNEIKKSSNIDNSYGLALAYKLKERLNIKLTKKTENLKREEFTFKLKGNTFSEVINIAENIDHIADEISEFFSTEIDNTYFSNIIMKYDNNGFIVNIDYIGKTQPKSEIKKWRKIVDDIDSELILMLSNRFIQAQQLAYMKKEAGLPVEDLDRENEILKNIENCGLCHANAIKEVYKTIFKEMKGIEAHENDRHIR